MVTPADTVPVDFSGYTTGSVRGQGTPPWTGADCGGTVDQAVVDNTTNPNAPKSFGAKSLRLSNAFVGGCFNDLFTPRTTNAAGDSNADPGAFPVGVLQPFFDASFSVASFTGALQPGLRVQVSPDRGDGARMSYVGIEHLVGGGINFDFYDVQGVIGTAPCFQCANFVLTDLGTYDETIPHTVEIQMVFNDAPGRDVVKVFIDGQLKVTGGSWEDYYTMDTESSPNPPRVSRTVDSLLIRGSGTAQPGLAGEGFLFGNITISTGAVPLAGSPSGGGGAGAGGGGVAGSPAGTGGVGTLTVGGATLGAPGATGAGAVAVAGASTGAPPQVRVGAEHVTRNHQAHSTSSGGGSSWLWWLLLLIVLAFAALIWVLFTRSGTTSV